MRHVRKGAIPPGVSTYRWTHSQEKGSRVAIPESSVNILLEWRGMEEIHNPIPVKEEYPMNEVADVLALSRFTFYLNDGALAQEIGFIKKDVTVFSRTELLRYFGEEHIPLGDGRTIFDIEDAALLTGTGTGRLHELVEMGRLRPTSHNLTARRQMVERGRLLEWVESKRGAYDYKANVRADKARKRAYALRVKEERAKAGKTQVGV